VSSRRRARGLRHSGIVIIVGVAVLVPLASRRPTRRASLGMLVGVTAMTLDTLAIKILVYDYP